ncbi:hypothetical protein [Schlesneria paludicola]|uniref:hypothetical protein n=1 Tax=Schlesneria paludicola TaxID=360056 RepID=UPI00029A00CF|nr:hypothetical protein [Schlesneria paludicola]
MNTVAKILVVFVAASSLAFLAFAAALRNGGPDWKGEMRSPELQKEFVFSVENGDKTTYSVKHRRTDSSVIDKTPVLAEAVLKARKRLDEETTKRLQELSPKPEQLQTTLKTVIEFVAADKKGVEAREQTLDERFQQLWADVQAVGVQFSELTLQTQDVLRVMQERREEVYRLVNQLELLRNDHFAAQVQQKYLEDELIRLEENQRKLESRQSQLKQQLGEGY